MQALYDLIKKLDISDARLQEGSLRIEPNVSMLKIKNLDLPDYKVEVKNINSFKFARRKSR